MASIIGHFPGYYNTSGVTVTRRDAVVGVGVVTLLEGRLMNVRESPTLWSIPFAILMVILIMAAADMLFPFLPLNISRQTWMWAVSTLITTIISSLVTEIISLNNRRALISMGLAAIVSTVIYIDLSKFIQRTVVEAVQGVIPNPLLGSAMYTVVLTVVPGALTGVILGGIFGFFPIPLKTEQAVQNLQSIPIQEPPAKLPKGQWSGFEKLCTRCGHPAPFESKFCPFCGVELVRQQAPPVRFCRFCGARIYLLGKYCPECGLEIAILSKPSVYISQ